MVACGACGFNWVESLPGRQGARNLRHARPLRKPANQGIYRPEPGSAGLLGRTATLRTGGPVTDPGASERPVSDGLLRCLASKIILELRAEPLAAGIPAGCAKEAEVGERRALRPERSPPRPEPHWAAFGFQRRARPAGAAGETAFAGGIWAAATGAAGLSLGIAARRSTNPVTTSTASPAAASPAQRPAPGLRGAPELSARPVSTTGGGVTLTGRARSDKGTCVRVAGGSNGIGCGNSPSISVRSGCSTGASLGAGTALGVRVAGTVDICTVVVPSCTVVAPSNASADTLVVLGTELTELDSPVLTDSVFGVVSDESGRRCVSASSERLASPACVFRRGVRAA